MNTTAVYQRRRSLTLTLPAAFCASLGIHLGALFGLPAFDFPSEQSRVSAAPMQVQIAVQADPSQVNPATPVRPPRPEVPRTAAPDTPTRAAIGMIAAGAKPGAKPLAHAHAGSGVKPAAQPRAGSGAKAPAQTITAPNAETPAQATAAPNAQAPAQPATAPKADTPAQATAALNAQAPAQPATAPKADTPAQAAANPDVKVPVQVAAAGSGAQGAAGEGAANRDRAPSAQPGRYPYREVKLEFDLFYGANPMRLGAVRHILRIEGDHYAIEQVGEGRGLVGGLYERVIGGKLIQRSAGTLGPSGFVPDEFFAQRGRVDRRESAAFNWSDGSIVLSSRGDERKLALLPGTQDMVSMLHQLFFMQPLPRSGKLIIATGRKVGDYAFEVLGEDKLETPLGAIAALHVKRIDPDGDRVELWLDPAHGMLPVRIYSAYRDGLVLDFVVRSTAAIDAQ